MSDDLMIASSLAKFTERAHVKITDKKHPHYGATGVVVRFQKYGPNNMFSGWLVNLVGGVSTFGKREQMKVI